MYNTRQYLAIPDEKNLCNLQLKVVNVTNEQTQNERLSMIMEAFEFTQVSLAQRIGYSQEYVSQMISGKRKISGGVLQSIAKTLPEVNLDWLIRGTGEMRVVETYLIEPPTTEVKDTSEPGYGLIEQLQAEVASLRGGLEDLKKRFEEFRSGNVS